VYGTPLDNSSFFLSFYQNSITFWPYLLSGSSWFIPCFFYGVHVAQSFVFCVVARSLFVLFLLPILFSVLLSIYGFWLPLLVSSWWVSCCSIFSFLCSVL
jgi:hypothetical protein